MNSAFSPGYSSKCSVLGRFVSLPFAAAAAVVGRSGRRSRWLNTLQLDRMSRLNWLRIDRVEFDQILVVQRRSPRSLVLLLQLSVLLLQLLVLLLQPLVGTFQLTELLEQFLVVFGALRILFGNRRHTSGFDWEVELKGCVAEE